ncbi:MAG: hypothetical protein OXE44_16180 [Nitrospinae bacterium]|nr:hypothetical protein [Nitrospinota bacterium]
MRNRFLKNIRTVKFVMCATALFISIGILFGSASIPRTQSAEAHKKSKSGMTVLERNVKSLMRIRSNGKSLKSGLGENYEKDEVRISSVAGG